MKSSKPSFRLAAAGLLAALTLTLSTGCIAVALGVGAGAAGAAFVYVRGDLEATVDANLERAIRATNKTVEDLKFAKMSEKKDSLVGVIVARNADDKRIEIRLEGDGDKHTKLRIRVGVIGDQALSLTIYEKIKANL